MRNANNYSITLTAGGVYRQLVSGQYFKITSATGTVSVKSERARLDSLSVGQGMESTPFDWLEFTDTSGAGNTVKFVVADNGFLDGSTGNVGILGTANVNVVNTPNVSVTASVQPISGAFSHAQITVTTSSSQILAANASRKYFLIQNNDATGVIFLTFGVSALLTTGIRIAPGGVYEMSDVQTSQTINVIGDIASNTNVIYAAG